MIIGGWKDEIIAKWRIIGNENDIITCEKNYKIHNRYECVSKQRNYSVEWQKGIYYVVEGEEKISYGAIKGNTSTWSTNGTWELWERVGK